MTAGGDPFAQAPGDPFAPQTTAAYAPGPPISYGMPAAEISSEEFLGTYADAEQWQRRQDFGAGHRPLQQLNTYAVLAPVFGVLIPPAGVALGHLALPQIRRTGQRGWLAAIWGLVVGYLFCVVLVVCLIWLNVAIGNRGDGDATSSPAQGPAPSPSVVTSIAPAPARPHTKLDLHQANVGKCAEIQKRDEGAEEESDEALDLYEVPCEHRVGVYTVAARVSSGAECNSTYVASPPDRSLAICLNRY